MFYGLRKVPRHEPSEQNNYKKISSLVRQIEDITQQIQISFVCNKF